MMNIDPTEGPKLERPKKFPETPPPEIPDVSGLSSDTASVTLSQHRTKLSTHRTGLSEHRTSLSEYRTDLSTYRTDLSTSRTEMSMRRTGMSFQRTRMSADRTLMSVIRTALSLISFGFTLFSVLQKLSEKDILSGTASARRFGISLVALGIGMLILGIIYHANFMLGLRSVRGHMAEDHLIYGESGFPTSLTLITAMCLLAIGITAIVSMVFNVGPFR